MMPKLMTEGQGKPLPELQLPVCGPEIFQAMPCTWTDWEEARLVDVCAYLRGGRSLAMPSRWKAVFPTTMYILRCGVHWEGSDLCRLLVPEFLVNGPFLKYRGIYVYVNK